MNKLDKEELIHNTELKRCDFMKDGVEMSWPEDWGKFLIFIKNIRSMDNMWVQSALQSKIINHIDKQHEIISTLKPSSDIGQARFNRAIELLEACSEDLFITDTDKELERHIDTFLNEVKS